MRAYYQSHAKAISFVFFSNSGNYVTICWKVAVILSDWLENLVWFWQSQYTLPPLVSHRPQYNWNPTDDWNEEPYCSRIFKQPPNPGEPAKLHLKRFAISFFPLSFVFKKHQWPAPGKNIRPFRWVWKCILKELPPIIRPFTVFLHCCIQLLLHFIFDFLRNLIKVLPGQLFKRLVHHFIRLYSCTANIGKIGWESHIEGPRLQRDQ